MFFKKWTDIEKPKKNLRTGSWERIGSTDKWDRLRQVEVQVGQGQGSSIFGGTGWDWGRRVSILCGIG